MGCKTERVLTLTNGYIGHKIAGMCRVVRQIMKCECM